jgi:hypothetical protein
VDAAIRTEEPTATVPTLASRRERDARDPWRGGWVTPACEDDSRDPEQRQDCALLRHLSAVVFGCDGTLVDTEPLAWAAWARVLAPSHRPMVALPA